MCQSVAPGVGPVRCTANDNPLVNSEMLYFRFRCPANSEELLKLLGSGGRTEHVNPAARYAGGCD